MMFRGTCLWLLAAVVFFCPNVGEAQSLHTPTNCGPEMSQTLVEFQFGTQYDWTTPGALSQTFTNVGFSGHNMDITISGETGTLLNTGGTGLPTPSVDFVYSPTGEALSLLTSGIGNGNKTIDILLEFSPALPGEFGFELFHINQSGSGDKLDVTARTQNGTLLNPTFTLPANPTYQTLGNSTLNATTFTTLEESQAGVNFSTPDSIASVLISWSDCNGCGVATHGMAMGNFEFCRKFVDHDEDGIEDQVDVDDDNDGIPDVTEACGIPFANPDQDTIGIEITLDGYPEETSWELIDFRGNVLLSGGSYSNPADTGRLIQEELIIDADMQTVFKLKDVFGDALTSTPAGNFSILRNGTVLIGPIFDNWGYEVSFVISPLGAPYNKFACLGSDFTADDDGDGIWNYADADFCTLNSFGVCANLDTDKDGVIDAFDLDADNDGIVDNIEGQGSLCFTPTISTVDQFGMPLTYIDYLNCADNNTTSTYGIVPNYDNSDSDGIPDFQDLDTDGDGVPDYSEGFDFNGSSESFDDFNTLASGFSGTNGSTASYPSGTDSDGDLIPDWLDNDPLNPGFQASQLPPFQTPGSPFYFDTDGDGVVDLLDADNGGSWPGFPPDNDGDGDPDWRDLDNTTSLPVDFLSFEARRMDSDAELQWNTAQEIGLSHFKVFRSEDGVNFEPSGEVEAIGNSQNHYNFVDYGVINSMDKQVFYRLEAVNLDGSKTLSGIRLIQWGNTAFEVSATVYPNPATDLLNIQVVSPGELVQLALFDPLGRQIWQEEQSVNEVLKIQKDISELRSGVYLLVIETAGNRKVIRLTHP